MVSKIPPENDDRNPHPLDADSQETQFSQSTPNPQTPSSEGIGSQIPGSDKQKIRRWHHPSWAIVALLFALSGALIGLIPFVGFLGYVFSLTAVGIGIYHLVNRITFKYIPLFPALALGLGLLALAVPVMSSSWMVNNGPVMLMEWIQEQGWDMTNMPLEQQRIPGLEVQSVRYETREWNNQQSELHWQAVISHRDSVGVDMQVSAIFMDDMGNVIWRSAMNRRLIPIVNDTLSKVDRLSSEIADKIESMSLNVEHGL